MAHYHYEPLANDCQCIRLLRLMPGPHMAAGIECELFHTKIENCPPYEALSYTWGDASQTNIIRLSGCPFPATVNLDVALRYLRSTSEPRVLWVDAVCINQDDLKEQAAQVKMMWEIYKNASRVVVWLGPTTGDSAVAMENIGSRDSQTKFVARQKWDRPNKKCSCHAGNFDNYESRIGVQNLLNSPWFTRVWVLQEAAAAKELIVACGNKTVTGQDFFDEVTGLALTCRIGTLQRSIRRCRHAIDLFGKQNATTSGTLTSRSMPILELIERFRSWDATKLVDKHFALLAFSSDASHAPELQPDYTISEEALALKIIRFALPNCIIDSQFLEKTGIAFEIEGLLLGDIRSRGGLVNGPKHYSFSAGNSKAPKAVWNTKVCELFKEDNGWEIMLEDERKLNDSSAVVLLRGASRPSVIKIHEGEVIVEMMATPEPTMGEAQWFGLNTAKRLAAWPAALADLAKETDGWMKFKLVWDPFGPPHPSAIERYIPTPNDEIVQWDACIESMKDQVANGAENQHDCHTISMMWMMYQQDSEAIKAGTSKLTYTLHKAAYNGYLRTVKLLLDARADVNENIDPFGTPLHVAVLRGHIEVVKALLDASADVHAVNRDGETPLLLAMLGGNGIIGNLLVAAGAVPPMFDSMPPESKLLHHAMCGRTDDVKELLAAGIDPNFGESGETHASATALHCAAEMGRVEVIIVLLAAGAHVNPRTHDGKNPLHLAAMNGHTEAVKALLAAGADVNALTSIDDTPLNIGLFFGKLDASRAIWEAGGRTFIEIFGQDNGYHPHHRSLGNQFGVEMAHAFHDPKTWRKRIWDRVEMRLSRLSKWLKFVS